jgi:transcriptional regulator GlxA family with amidase domain
VPIIAGDYARFTLLITLAANTVKAMKIAVLDFEGSIGSSVAGPYDFFTKTPLAFQLLTGKALPVTLDADIVQRAPLEGMTAANRVSIRSRRQYDLVIIPAMDFDCIHKVIAREKELIAWVKKQHDNGAEIASICLGAFVLAETGLLNGRRATTHWLGAPMFREMYPEVKLEDDKIIVDEGRIYTCAGAYTFTTFMIYLIEKFCGHEAAFIASKVFMVAMHNQPQKTFSIFQLQQAHTDDAIKSTQQFIEKNYKKRLRVEDLASLCNMSSRNFIRRFEQATGNTSLEYQQRVRIEAAKRILEEGKQNIEQAACSIGYDDLSFFRKVFKRHVGISPRAYKDRYARNTPETLVRKRAVA